MISKRMQAASALAVTAAASAAFAIVAAPAAPPYYRTPAGTGCKELHATGTALPLDVKGILKRCSHRSLTSGGGTFSLRGGRSLKLAITWNNGTTTSTTLRARHLHACATGELFLLENRPVTTGRPEFVGTLAGMGLGVNVCVATSGNDITMTLPRQRALVIH